MWWLRRQLCDVRYSQPESMAASDASSVQQSLHLAGRPAHRKRKSRPVRGGSLVSLGFARVSELDDGAAHRNVEVVELDLGSRLASVAPAVVTSPS